MSANPTRIPHRHRQSLRCLPCLVRTYSCAQRRNVRVAPAATAVSTEGFGLAGHGYRECTADFTHPSVGETAQAFDEHGDGDTFH